MNPWCGPFYIHRQGISRFAQFACVFLTLKYFVPSNRKHKFSPRPRPRAIVQTIYRLTSGGWLVGSWQKVLLFLTRNFFLPRTHVLVQILVNFGGQNWREIKRGCEENCDKKVNRKAPRQFSQISGWISVGRENNYLESYIPMSSKTQSKQRGKIQPLKNVELSEYQKISNLHVQTAGMSSVCRSTMRPGRRSAMRQT